MYHDDLPALIVEIVTTPLGSPGFSRIYCDDSTLTEFDEQHVGIYVLFPLFFVDACAVWEEDEGNVKLYLLYQCSIILLLYMNCENTQKLLKSFDKYTTDVYNEA